MPQAVQSGAALRNSALHHAISAFADTTTIHVQSYDTDPAWHPKRGPSFVGATLGPDRLNKIIADVLATKPDIVSVEGVYLGEIVFALREHNIPVILDMHNIESDLRKQIDRHKGGPLAQALAPFRYRSRWAAAQSYECQVARAASAIWLCSRADKERLSNLAPDLRQLDVVPNPAPKLENRDEGSAHWVPHILFVGHLSYEPNVEAVLRLTKEIFPALRSHFPQACLTLAGRTPHRAIASIAAVTEGLELLANPPDLAPIYAAANLTIVPLRTGGGTRLKILEAMAYGVPVVASAKAVEGLDLTPGEEFLLADDNQSYVNAVKRFSSDPSIRSTICRAAQNYIQRAHSPNAIRSAVGASLALLQSESH